MIAFVISGGRMDRTKHPKWKYRLADNLVVWVSHKVEKPVEFRSESGYIIAEWRGHILTIYRGYMMDGASFWPDHEKGMRGFGVHDFGYQVAQILARQQWDLVMLSIHSHDGYKARHIVYGGVSVGGWASYGKRGYVQIIEL